MNEQQDVRGRRGCYMYIVSHTTSASPSFSLIMPSVAPAPMLVLLLCVVGNLAGAAAVHDYTTGEEFEVERKVSVVDKCDSCAAAGHALYDALSYQQAKMRARYGRDVKLAEMDPVDVARAAAEAANSACGARGYWERFRYKLVGATPPLLTLSGCLLYTSPSPRDATLSRMPSSA